MEALKSKTARGFLNVDLPVGLEPRLARAISILSDRPIIFDYYKGHLYIAVHNPPGGWQSAQKLARLAGGNLDTISDSAENRFVYELFSSDPIFFVEGPYGQVKGPNIGLYRPDGVSNVNAGWHWVDGEVSNYRNWQNGQPNDDNGSGPFVRFEGKGKKSQLTQLADKWYAKQGFGGSFVMEIE